MLQKGQATWDNDWSHCTTDVWVVLPQPVGLYLHASHGSGCTRVSVCGRGLTYYGGAPLGTAPWGGGERERDCLELGVGL